METTERDFQKLDNFVLNKMYGQYWSLQFNLNFNICKQIWKI